jgi:hypothetical protein
VAVERITIKLRGLNQVMRSPGAQARVDAVGARMAAAAGEGYEYQRSPHKWTARGFVQTANQKGRAREARSKVLNRVLSAGS